LEERINSEPSPSVRAGPAAGKAELTERVLRLQDRLFEALQGRQSSPWLSLDLTMSELKTLLVLASAGSASGGRLAGSIGVGLSTMTGIVDRLREQGLVSRGEDPDDRRVTRVALTGAGRALIAELQQSSRERFRELLARLDEPALGTVERAFDYLLRAALAESDEESTGRAR